MAANQPPPPVFGFPFIQPDRHLDHAALDFLTKLWGLATEGVVLPFYGSLQGKPTNGQILSSWLMTGVEQFPTGLTGNMGMAATAPTALATFNINVTPIMTGVATTIGTAGIAAAGNVMTWSMSQSYDASAYDVLQFVAPAAADLTMADIYWTFVATLA